MSHRYFLSGIGTNVGKTVVAAILAQLWEADYWKPIQAGDLHDSDSNTVRRLSKKVRNVHPERYKLKHPLSPHEAAGKEQLSIELSDFELPDTDNHLIVEGAGGLLVPLNKQHFIIDLIDQFNLPVILVVSDYLGCINHTLLSIKALATKEIPLAYVVFNGDFNPATKSIISNHLSYQTLRIDVPTLEILDVSHVAQVSERMIKQFKYLK